MLIVMGLLSAAGWLGLVMWVWNFAHPSPVPVVQQTGKSASARDVRGSARPSVAAGSFP